MSKPVANRRIASKSFVLLRQFAAIAALSLALVAPAFAESNDGREGLINIYTRTGGIIQKEIKDPAFLDSILKDATVIPEGAAIMMHGGKWYLVPEKKMADGKMMLDMISKK